MPKHENENDRSDTGTFHASFNDPPFPPPGKNAIYWRADTDNTESREYEDIMLRRVPATVAHHFRGAAGARGFTHAQYLAALVALHAAMRERADGGDTEVATVLAELGLGTVSI